MNRAGTATDSALTRFRIENPRTPEFVNGVKLRSDHHRCLLGRAVDGSRNPFPFGFYNLAPAGDPFRGFDFVQRELNAIFNNHPHDGRRVRPILGLAECIDRTLPKLAHGRLIQSTKNPSRKNVALYVPHRFPVGKIEWLDHEVTWDRVIHSGVHEARSTLFVKVADVLVGVGHAPQIDARNPENTKPARKEWVDLIADRLKDEKRFIFLSDPNALATQLAARLA